MVRRFAHRSWIGSWLTVAAASGAVVAVATLLASCSDGDASGGDPAPSTTASSPTLTGPAAVGETLVRDKGCTACHSVGAGDDAVVGPALVGLFGSEVELEDGSTVVADAAYLERSIRDPESQVTAGYAAIMPVVALDDAEVGSIVDYLREIGAPS